MLSQNLLRILKKGSEQEDTYKLKKIKASDKQKELINEKPQILHKAFIAQQTYNKSSWLTLITIILILFISIFFEDTNVYKIGSLMISTIIMPMIISLIIVSSSQMSEVDNATIYKEDSVLNVTPNNDDEKKLLKDAIIELSKSNNLLKENLDIMENTLLQNSDYKKKVKRKFR